MPRSRVAIRISRDDYDLFAKAMPDEPWFSPSYDDWLKGCLEKEEQDIANGFVLHEVVINYKTFADYGRATGQKLSHILLMAHAVAKATSKP